eukprot:CAMPEP_0116030354 /NCGR_PEP_ID=MMETSP0321-20121206/16804_1 /TAXON_ID=163516 /ORGANISM="Leptocylindrus danicus var. danicus, Strain B650" /LENGTH=467 /DNA_ID=CAMNT_0003505143 /DNA_START=57 /DNA_END=1460 /DNA_ORIENTATION=+
MTETTSSMSTDLTPIISPFLDLHMLFPLLEYMDGNPKITYSSKEIAAARLDLLGPTHMVDYAMDIYKDLNGTSDDAELAKMEKQKQEVYQTLEDLRKRAAAFEEFVTSHKAKLGQKGDWNFKGVLSASGGKVRKETIECYRQLAKFNYDCGDYQAARDMLRIYISLFVNSSEEEGENNYEALSNSATTNLLEALWGKLSCDILLENWEDASSALKAVRTVLEALSNSNRMAPLESLRQRTWLLHWGLFVFWNDRKGLDQMMDLFTTEKYLQVITTNAPHLIRYLTAAVLIGKRRSQSGNKMMRELLRVMSNCNYTDPIIEFVQCLCVKFDFDGAQAKLAECENVLTTDFFLCKQTELFMEEARIFIFENYCRIHSKLRVTDLAEKLAMDPASAERWIVDLIRNTDGLSAKIDWTENTVSISGSNRASVHETILDRTKDLNARSAMLMQNMKNMLEKERERKEAEYDD